MLERPIKNIYWGKQGENTRPSNWRKNSKTNSFVGEAPLRGDLTGKEVTLDAERKKVSSHPHKNTGKPAWVQIGYLSAGRNKSMIEDQLAAL